MNHRKTSKPMCRSATSLISFLLLPAISLVASEETSHENFFRYDPIFGVDSETENCEIYLAPSEKMGWGVYAGRDFEENEVVEVVPRYLTLKNDWLALSVLDDYHYGFTFNADESDTTFGALIFGKAMFYNHGHKEKQNIIYTSFGYEPHKDMPWGTNMLGFVAKRDIKRGEELLCTYGEGQWFTDRSIEMNIPEDEPLPSFTDIQVREKAYCSKVLAGIGHSTYVHRLAPAQAQAGFPLPDFDYVSRLPLQDHPTAIAREFAAPGDLLEVSPALVLIAELAKNSPLAPLTFFWDDLEEGHKESVRELREMGAYRMKGYSNETYQIHHDLLEYFDDSCIFPAAGNIAMIRKVGHDSPNCKMEIAAPADSQEELNLGSAGLVLKIIATREIQSGEELRLNLPDNSSWDSKMALQQHLALSGQPIPRHLAEIGRAHV